MSRFNRPAFVAALLASALSFGAAAAEHAHWSYSENTGPTQWAALDPDNQLCETGRQQSPIALKKSESKRLRKNDIAIHYGVTKGQLINNGHTIQFNVIDPGNDNVVYKAGKYSLAQFHFHTPSEHHLNGKSYPMEMHLVNKDADSKITVVGVFIKEGAKNATLGRLWEQLPAPDAKTQETEIDLSALLPKVRNALLYTGSLTTPPCSEQVNWIVLEKPIEMSRQQIKAFQKLFHDNHRPLQPTNRREVLENAPSAS